jgi:hypothetical protein
MGAYGFRGMQGGLEKRRWDISKIAIKKFFIKN